MIEQTFWKGITALKPAPNQVVPEKIIKLCSLGLGEDFLALSVDHVIYRCTVENDTITFCKLPGIQAIDIAFNSGKLYIIDYNGRIFESKPSKLEERREVVVKEEAKCCVHGFKTSSYKVKFKNVILSDFGQIFVSKQGQLWASGEMPQMSVESTQIKKISFFEGRTIYGVSLGANFAVVISRKNIRNSSGNDDTNSEDEDDVFVSSCLQCQSTLRLASPPSLQSLSETCPLGIHVSKSSGETSSTSVPQIDVQIDTQSLTEDTSPSTEDSNVTRRLESKAAVVDEPVTTFHEETSISDDCTGELGDDLCEEMKKFNPDKQNNIIFTNKEAAKQFLSRQLSWVSAGEDYLVEYTEKPTRIIKENVSNLTNFVFEGVKTVGDKVATLSRHVSGSSDPNETMEVIDKNMDDIHSLLNSFASSYKLDELHFSMSTVASDREYHNVTNEKANTLIKIGQSILNTEIWTWGDIEHGQLGIGDTIHRSRPMLVSSLSGLGIQKVSCGSFHCAALSLDGRLFSWGRNNYHQVSFESREDKSSPILFTENGNTDRIRDVVSSEDHNIAYTLNHNLLYTGKYFMGYTENPQKLDYKKISDASTELNVCNEAVKTKNESLSDNLDTLKQCDLKCYHWKILSSGNMSYLCIDNKIQSRAIQELSVSQKILEELLLIYHSLIKPFLKRSQIVTLHNNVYEQLCNLFANIVYITALNVLSIWQYTENHVDEHEISMIKNCEEYIYLYQKYLNIICNVICLSGFAQIANIIEVPTVIYDLFSDQLPSSSQKNNKKTAEAIIALAFLHPLSRLSSYKCIIQSLSRYNEKKEDRDLKKSVEQKLLDVLSSWDVLAEENEKQKKDAEITRLFWETCGKTLEQYIIPERRLIRESRSKPLHMLNAGRFSTHWFILFNDIFIHVHGSSQTVHPLETLWIEPLGDTDNLQNALQLITPEETFGVSTNTSQDKSEWLHAFQMYIKILLRKTNSFQPPAVRTATYQFSNKANFYKDAKYMGRWLNGKIHGMGKVEWPDGKVYIGQFHMNSINGHGKMDIPGIGIYDGHWKENLQCGFGVLKYNSGDVYEGYFREGLAHGHGVRKQGDFNKSTATIYMGEWQNGVRHGYGVMDDILKGEKYLGSWCDNKKHGCGLIVTLDGIYYEGVFMQDVLTGHGVMIFEDGTHYEGEFRSAGVFSGKGTLIFSSGDRIEGSFSGAWTEGVKISSGTLKMNVSSPALPDNTIPNSFGRLCVAPNQKWNGLFRQCFQRLGIPENLLTPNGTHFCATSALTGVDNKKIWQNVAVMISSSQKERVNKSISPEFKRSPDHKSVDQLELIPHFGQKALTLDSFVELRQYLHTACESTHHPLGQLVQGVTSAFNTTYGGVRVHPLLLSHAVKELKSITCRIYHIVRLLFPVLPPDGCDIVLPYDEHAENHDDNNPIDGEIISAAALLQPTLLPRVHPSLFVLYALHNKREDDLYWRRLIKWNRQPDITLMASLGIDQKFWVGYTTLQGQGQGQAEDPKSPSYSPLKEQLFTDAVETLQQLKTTFSPIEKLLVIRSTFQRMTTAVQDELGASYLWSMDELFPVFHFVVVRARILQLGSEIHFIEDFLEPCMQNGELGIMFTTLKACYFQILQEKMSISS